MASAPVISIFRSTGGPPEARGVLVQGLGNSRAGLFSPWPKSLTDKVAFGVYVPGDMNSPAQWLAPKLLGILKGIDNKGGTLGVVSFTSVPTRMGGEESISEHDFREMEKIPSVSRWDALKAARANDLKTLGTLKTLATLDSSPSRTKPVISQKPKVLLTTAATIKPGDFFCRYLLRWD